MRMYCDEGARTMMSATTIGMGLMFLGGFLGGELVAMLTNQQYYAAALACACGIVCIAMSRRIAP